MGCKYVKEFSFGGAVKSCGCGGAMKKAQGGSVKSPAQKSTNPQLVRASKQGKSVK